MRKYERTCCFYQPIEFLLDIITAWSVCVYMLSLSYITKSIRQRPSGNNC
jgi:hypothetical protein